jgi:hypothetical protein
MREAEMVRVLRDAAQALVSSALEQENGTSL